MKPTSHILVVEDDATLGDALSAILSSEGYRVSCSRRGDEGCREALGGDADLVVTDLRLPGLDGIDLVRNVREARPNLPIILMTAHDSPTSVIESAKAGVIDYLCKPFEMDEFLASVRRCLQGVSAAPFTVGDVEASAGLVGRSRAMQSLYKEIGRLAPRPVTVLVRGETGTGKELVARALHQHSTRSSKPFVAVNCAALSEALLESEIFGHERGAFTGAVERRIGRFEQAAGGTLFLDEIGELTPSTQAKLLRVLQEGTFERVGGRQVIQGNVRVIAATHLDIDSAIMARTFREDLYYRLSQSTILVPPLRERPEDIADLARHFVQVHAPRLGLPAVAFSDDVIAELHSHPWPGNVRELENVVRQVLIKSNGQHPMPSDAAGFLRATALAPSPAARDGLAELIDETLTGAERGDLTDGHGRVVRVVERALLQEAMRRADGNQSQVARWLGISRFTLRERLRALGLHPWAD